MSREKIRIRYDGPALAEHSIDLDDLAISLLALGDLCKLANKQFNGDRASVKFLVQVDLEQNCFELSLELVQTILSITESVFKRDEVVSAGELLFILGIGTGTSFGLIKTLAWLRGKSIDSSDLEAQENDNSVRINVKGDSNTINVDKRTYILLRDPQAIEKVKKVVSFMENNDAYDSLEFQSKNGDKEVISKNDAHCILGAENPKDDEEDPQELTVWIETYAPVYNESATSWRFLLNGKPEYMDITETDIAQKAMERGSTSVGDSYQVRLVMSQKRTSQGRFTASYKIKEVFEFRESTLIHQSDMFNKDES